MREAMLYEKINDLVQCNICIRRCKIPLDKTGFCGTRKHKDGKLYSLVYGRPVSAVVDPIEKKPFMHFHPGTDVFSIATVGCNFRCLYCQNWSISQAKPEEVSTQDLPPKKVVETAKNYGSHGIAYTYTEPVAFYEYCYDTMEIGQKAGLYNVFVTNGYMTPEALDGIGELLDGANIDVKGFTEEFYRKVPKAHLQPVLDTCIRAKKKWDIHVEITNLVVPNYNDKEDEIRDLVTWVRDKLGKDTPLHFSRFWPHHKMQDVPPTPTETLEEAREIGLDEGLHYVYLGNVPGHPGENTYCPNCGELLIDRYGFEITQYEITKDKKCPNCRTEIAIRGNHIEHLNK